MKIGVWTSDYVLARETIERLEKTELGEIYYRCLGRANMKVQDRHGNVIQWLRPYDNSRGYKLDKAYVDVKVNTDILFNIILPCLWQGEFEDVIWIAGDRTTVYEYLHALPQPLFEATLLGLMGLPLDTEKEEWFHKWMERPYNEVFPTYNLSALKSSITTPLNHMTMLLGKTAETLPKEKQEQLAHAMREYCEVCDYINQGLANQQKKSE